MLLNYLKIAIRNIQRNKLHSFINIIGLSIGMACSMLLLLLIRYELSYDKHNSKHDRIYMVQSHFKYSDSENFNYGTYYALGPTLKDEYPEIEESVRIYKPVSMSFIDKNNEPIGEDQVCYADPGVFNVFDHKFIYGSVEGALDNPHSMVLSESLAKKYFGDHDPTGEILTISDGTDYKVTGVFKDLPPNTFRRYTALLPMIDFAKKYGTERFNSRNSCEFFNHINQTYDFYTYILLKKDANIANITGDHERFREKYISECGKKRNYDFTPVFQPLSEVYLYLRESLNSPPFVLITINLLSALALCILIIACINYINLTTAKSTGRAREVGVRKVLGADRVSLIMQLLCESILLAAIALLLALVMIDLLLPAFNELSGKELSFNAVLEPKNFAGLLILTLFVGIISGSYPSFFLSSFLPVNVLKNNLQSGKRKGVLRKILVVAQFTMSIIMIVVTFTLQKEITYLTGMDRGFNYKDILVINVTDWEAFKAFPVFKKEILKNNEITAVARSNRTAVLNYYEGYFQIEDAGGEMIKKLINYVEADFDFIDLMEIDVLEGRSFSREMRTDQAEAFLINETLVKEMGWTESSIGKRIQFGQKNRKVIGVLKDFHFRTKHNKLPPTIITLNENTSPLISIRLQPGNSKETVEFIKKKWFELNPAYYIEPKFLIDIINDDYTGDRKILKILKYSSFFSIFISSLGLFGLSSFLAEKKKKEIGIRKTYGASSWNIIIDMFYYFTRLILISSLIAWPVLIILDMMPKTYFYGPDPSWWLFPLTVCITMAIAFISVAYHAVKASMADPVKAIRYE